MLLSVLGHAAPNPGLWHVRTIYILPMSSSLDQYLANALVKDGHFNVVTDPQLADAFFTDRIGQSFETKLKELLPPPDAAQQKSDDENAKQVRVGGFSRSRGTVFLVQRDSRAVVWSVYEPPKGTTSHDFENCAGHIMDQLRKDLKSLAKQAPASAEPARKPAADATPTQEPAAPATPAPEPPEKP